MRKPINKLTIEQIAAKIYLLPVNQEFNFAESEDGSNYWGAKRMNVFEYDIIIIGYYGWAPTFWLDLNDPDGYQCLLESMLQHFSEEFLWVFE